MKNLSKTIAAISLSLLTVGAFGQAPGLQHLKATHLVRVPSRAEAKKMNVLHEGHSTKSVMSMQHIDLQYFNTDLNIVGQSNYAYWNPPGYCNMNYGWADTGAGTNKNYNLNHAAIVAFDTLVDAGDVPYTAVSGTVTVDTIFLDLGYHNTSGMNDTLVIHIGKVGANGYPTGAFYTNDTVVVPASSSALPGLYLDSIYEIYIIPNGGSTYTIPGSAPAGYKFNVTMEVYGSKLDTLGAFYGSPYFSCSPYDWASRTQVGPTMGAAANVNSFMTGFQFYNTAGYGGDGTTDPVLTWPNSGGRLYNYLSAFGDFWGTTGCATPDDTGYIYFQDHFIAVAIDYNDNTGVSNIANAGLSVGQNYPNPFNKETSISYSLTKSSDVTFTVYDITGRVIANNNYGSVASGQHTINLSANTFSPGIYFYTFNVNGSTVTKKMVITE